MQSQLTKKHALSLLIAFCVLVSFSQSIHAAKPVKNPPSTIVIDSVTVDDLNNTVVITGNGLQNANAVTLGGVDVQSAISPVSDNQLRLNFNASTAAAVPAMPSWLCVPGSKLQGSSFGAGRTLYGVSASSKSRRPQRMPWCGPKNL